LTLAGVFLFQYILKDIDMRILVLTLMMSFLSHSAFGAAEGGGAEECTQTQEEGTTFETFPEEIRQLTTTFLSLKDSPVFAQVSKSSRDLAREAILQKGFTLNMEVIEEENKDQLAQLLFQTRNVTKLKIKNIKWEILKAVLESNLELKFDNLEKLDLSANTIDEKMIQEINDLLFSRIRRLTSLNLSLNQIGEAGAEAIAGLTRLTSLNLSWNQIGVEGARAIANSPHISSLTSLDLSYNQIGNAGATAIANSPYIARLTSLNLECSRIGVEGARAIALMSSLTSLNLCCNQIGADGARAIANSQHMANLTSLNLGGNQLGPAGATAIANSPHMARLTSLTLGSNLIGAAGATAIAESEYMARLTSLNLYNNQIREAGARAIANSPHMARLNSLNLGDNYIGDEGATAIAESEHMASLNRLNLWGNQIGAAVKAEIIAILANCKVSL
jgi:Leucine-rich repeat (LRR) protein